MYKKWKKSEIFGSERVEKEEEMKIAEEVGHVWDTEDYREKWPGRILQE